MHLYTVYASIYPMSVCGIVGHLHAYSEVRKKMNRIEETECASCGTIFSKPKEFFDACPICRGTIFHRIGGDK